MHFYTGKMEKFVVRTKIVLPNMITSNAASLTAGASSDQLAGPVLTPANYQPDRCSDGRRLERDDTEGNR